jgi:hypothetical protein
VKAWTQVAGRFTTVTCRLTHSELGDATARPWPRRRRPACQGTQTCLAANAQLKFHRQLGIASTAWVLLIVLSGVVTWYHFLSDRKFPVEHFFYDTFFVALINLIMFCLLFTWALLKRRHDLMAHERLLLLNMVPLLEAASDRIHWLPL